MAQTFYWYDLETSGTQPKWDRIVQFAGMRTNMDLEPVDDGDSFYLHLGDDVLPNPDASLVTGLVPQHLQREGISEWQGVQRLLSHLATPGTCAAGYNSLRFDDEFVRYGLFRNFFDPYAREWQGGNRRWDLIDLVRATGALRPEGIRWPQDADGLPVYKLEELSAANDLEHGHAHDAMSDVRATVALARLIRQKQPKLFDYYLNHSNKKSVRKLLEPFGERLCVHVSGMYPRQRYGCAPIVSLCRHPTNSNAIIVLDLGQDVENVLEWSAEDIAERLFTSGDHERPGLKELRINRCPFVAAASVLQQANQDRLGIDLTAVKRRWDTLRNGTRGRDLQRKLHQVYARPPQAATVTDLDGSLYDGFIGDEDRQRCVSLQDQLRSGNWQDLDFSDQRLTGLAERLKARSFTSWLTPRERADWDAHIAWKLRAPDAPWLTLDAYFARIGELRQEHTNSTERLDLLQRLHDHGTALERRYGG